MIQRMASRVIALAIVTTMAYPQDDVWRKMMDEGASLEREGNYRQAVAKYLAIAGELQKSIPRDLRVLTTLNSLANAYSESSQVMEAEHEYRHALQVAGEVRGQESADYASLLSSLAALYLEEGSVVKGEKVLRESLAIYSKALSVG